MYHWSGVSENGNELSLSFEDATGFLDVDNGDSSLSLEGLSIVTDDRLIICDKNSGANYLFAYRLFGDRVELTRNGSVISLKKVVPS